MTTKRETGTYHGRRSGPPGDTTEYWMPRDFNEWEAAWNKHLEAQGHEVVHYEPINVSRPAAAKEQLPVNAEAKAREQEAIRFITEYTGRFGFILDLRARRGFGTKWYSLSERQVDAVLRVKAQDEARTKERKQTGRDLTVLPVGRTYAAVTNESGATTFLIFDRPADLDRYKQPNKWAGWVFVKQFIGGIGEGQRLGSQRPGESYSGQWANLVDQVIADPMGAVQRFGRELGICGVCNLPLTNEESREFGIGPVCRAKLAGEGE